MNHFNISFSRKNIIFISFILFLGGALFFYLRFFDPSQESNLFLPCPSKLFLGLNCPGCGSQRALHHLFNLNFTRAIHYNPLIVIGFPFLVYLVYVQLYNLLFQPKIRIPIFYNERFVWTLFAVIIIYTVLRNIPLFGWRYLIPPA